MKLLLERMRFFLRRLIGFLTEVEEIPQAELFIYTIYAMSEKERGAFFRNAYEASLLDEASFKHAREAAQLEYGGKNK